MSGAWLEELFCAEARGEGGGQRFQEERVLKALSSSLLAGGSASSSDLTNIVLLKMLERMEKSESKKDKKKKDADELWDPLGGSASDSKEESATYCSGGMRAMNSVHKMQNRVRSHSGGRCRWRVIVLLKTRKKPWLSVCCKVTWCSWFLRSSYTMTSMGICWWEASLQ